MPGTRSIVAVIAAAVVAGGGMAATSFALPTDYLALSPDASREVARPSLSANNPGPAPALAGAPLPLEETR